MKHDVYICYNKKDKDICDAVYQIFNENNISTWIKSKNMTSNDSVDKITKSIESSKCFILVYSNNSKNTNYVITETDIAFSRNVPIIVLNIDNIPLNKNMEFILSNQITIPAFPNYEEQLKILVKKTSDNISKPVEEVKLNSKSLKVFKRINPKRNENTIKRIITFAIPAIIALILIYFLLIVPSGQHTTEDGIFTMNITDVDVSEINGEYKYTVFGESYNMPSHSDKYVMNIKFFDKNENTVFEVNSTADEFKSGVICSCSLDDDNITHISFKLIDLTNEILSSEDYKI